MKFLFYTNSNHAGLIARIVLGAVMLPHGIPKLVNFEQSMVGLTANLGLSHVVAFLVIAGESVGAASLVLGFLSRFCALSIGVIMAGAVYLVHYQYGFFMNWRGNMTGEGYEYHVLAVGLALVVAVSGGGKFSLDRWITVLFSEGGVFARKN